jgi:hypothetical protein
MQEVNAWLRYDFKSMSVIPNEYEILSCPWAQYSDHPKSWWFEVSDDGNELNEWIEAPRYANDSSLNGCNLAKTFEVTRPVECRFVRLQIEKDRMNHSDLIISGIAIYGTLCDQ